MNEAAVRIFSKFRFSVSTHKLRIFAEKYSNKFAKFVKRNSLFGYKDTSN